MRLILELFGELTELNAIYAIYTGIILSLILKYIWTINFESWEDTSFANQSYEYKKNDHQIILKKFRTKSHLLFIWIIQIVRRKDATSSDETNHSIFFY
ncbi:hypothetical protein ACFSO7_16895 [Bacillus sp. CGMCC 1.16607]|uniref:hypothetical protein n=1 Tax=Bacillus sp. CGMCC 1.16607 TaxID=3351842 RepID=UPI003642F9D8